MHLYNPNVHCLQQGHMGSQALLQEDPPVFNCRCWLTQLDLYKSHRMVVCVYVHIHTHTDGELMMVNFNISNISQFCENF